MCRPLSERHIHRFSKFADERTGVQHNTQLLHAFQHRSHLTSKRAEFSHNIIIVDGNGCLAASARLAKLRESFEHDLTNEYAAHVGLYNIQKVIRLTYGAPYGVQIESTEGQGTAVTLTIPYEVEENEGC